MDGSAVETRNSRTRAHRAIAQRRKDCGIERRMHRGRTALRRLQSVFPPRPDLEAHDRPHRCLEHKARRVAQPVVSRPRIELVDRPPEDDLGQNVVALAHAETDGSGDPRDVDRDVAGRIAAADHQHPLVGERLGTLVFARMQRPARERSRIVRQQRITVMTGADDQVIEALDAFPGGTGCFHRPLAVAQPPGAFDTRVEHDLRQQVEARRIGVEIVEHLPVRGKIRIVLRHREILEFGEPLRGDQPRCLVDAASIGSVVIDPVAADRGRLLVADEVDSLREQVLDRGQAARARTDDTHGYG